MMRWLVILSLVYFLGGCATHGSEDSAGYADGLGIAGGSGTAGALSSGHSLSGLDAGGMLISSALSSVSRPVAAGQTALLIPSERQALSAPLGQSVSWNTAGGSGLVTPIEDYTSVAGSHCRRLEITGPSLPAPTAVTGCRRRDGRIHVVP